MARVYARIAGFALYRWGGEYTWMTTGPVSSGVSEPLPLPTTMLGAILGTNTNHGTELDEDSVLDALAKKLGCSRIEALRGPYYPGRDGNTILTHLYPGGLLRISLENGYGVVKGRVGSVLVSIRGTALHKKRKIASRGLLYSASLVDAVMLAEHAKPEVSIDAFGCTDCSYAETSKVGGDMRMALVSCEAEGLIERLLSEAKEVEYCLVASPILLEDAATVEKLLEGEEVEIKGCRVKPVTTETARRLLAGVGDEKEAEKLAKSMRLRVEILSPGVYGHNGFPRRPMLAVMPGAVLECRDCTRERLREGLGIYSRLGFGTLIPIQPPS